MSRSKRSNDGQSNWNKLDHITRRSKAASMSRSKRSNDQLASHEEAANAVHPPQGPVAARDIHSDNSNNSDDSAEGVPQTPSKKVRLQIGGSSDSAVQETQAAVGSVAVSQAVITPAANRIQSAGGDSGDGDDTARRALFTPPNSRPQLVTPSKSGASATAQSPAKRRIVFGRYSEIDVMERVKKVYRLIRKLTGSIGGNASNGPIYGELTMGSMQKMVNLMKEHTHFDASSKFIDVGSGIGKPNFHVAQDPGVEISYGLEIDADRWLLSMNCLRGTLDLAAQDEDVQHRCVFVQEDIRQAHSFDPFTHVYMFSIGFPPDLWITLADVWNRSKSPYLICYHSPKDIIDCYEFEVELLAKTPTSMHGSKEGHTGYVYRRTTSASTTAAESSTETTVERVDPLFAGGIATIRGGLSNLQTWVSTTLNAKMSSGPSTRGARRRSTRASSSST
eukprot:CAMPEP_0172471894 /NCGR_PEP_ID=MMETSP1065-20121228/68054_1 /TAXON_ID=265537 /ORGANISM="Amphiprora paludosa, Strain CCMP125" /LENGTH=448 /DNA_ID=CAMNT_0013230009 /DNA_START=341 /DNA_END=1687 /DNA_ORIENTATION=-